jgi:iron complex outermembrane receptor protein
VSGAEWEGAHRTEESSAEAVSSGEGDNLRARTQRVALYAQDEWNLNPHWAAHAGLRWEGITTRGSSAPDNRSSVFTPLLHAVWKPDPKGRDQLRFSLTRSYKSPTLSSLIARRQTSLNNAPTRPDRMGNPSLKPELATGLDVALERYLAEGGVLSANVFHRRIRDLIRTELLQEPDGRWLARPGNVGSATTQGLELEAKFRLSALVKEAPPIDLRTNASVFRSRVDSVPGPDNRLDQQPKGTANVGADWRLRGTPLTLGGNLNLTPGYATRESAIQSLVQSRKRVFDAYALWLFNPALQLRLTGSNLAPRDYETVNTVALQTADTVNDGHPSWRLQLEMKL